jgi:hypothetical protein
MQAHREATPGAAPPGPSGDGATPATDLLSAIVIGAIALALAVSSLGLQVPDDFSTAPGLLPLLVGAALLAMSLALAVRAIRDGALRGVLGGQPDGARRGAPAPGARRTLVLMALVTLYVVLVGAVEFDLRVPTPFMELAFSSYELISIALVAFIMSLFSAMRPARCVLVAALTIETIALMFRYGFGIVMPAMY